MWPPPVYRACLPAPGLTAAPGQPATRTGTLPARRGCLCPRPETPAGPVRHQAASPPASPAPAGATPAPWEKGRQRHRRWSVFTFRVMLIGSFWVRRPGIDVHSAFVTQKRNDCLQLGHLSGASCHGNMVRTPVPQQRSQFSSPSSSHAAHAAC